MTQTITVQYQNEVRPGKKLASIKTTDGEYFSVQPPVLQLLKPDHTYEVEFTQRDWQGKTYKTITNFQERQVPSDPVGKAPSVSGTGSVSAPNTSGGYQMPAERSARIERQHSQEMAIRLATLDNRLVMDGEGKLDLKKLRWFIDYFQRDVGRSPEQGEELQEPAQPDVP